MLEKIANDLFKSVPGNSPNTNENQDQIHHQFEHNDALKKSDGINELGKISPNLVNQNNFGLGKLPTSIAGSGISPSAIHHPSEFSIDDPQSSLPDPHFYNGQIPKAVAGSGKSPSLNNTDFNYEQLSSHQKLPFETDQHFDKELKE
ncbi:MAG TPA: hypothetical protein PK637_14455, partial [Flavobacteriales bacterium]|nr:hypothetical protein [Flavobacteriales bacterium]